MLWACLYFPRLALSAAFDGVPQQSPCALIDGPVRRRQVVAVNAAARAFAIAPAQTLAAAQVRCPALTARPRAPQAETRLLEELAAWSYQFSSQVVPTPPQSLLLEIGASLKLFDGWPTLERRLREGLQRLGHEHRLAAAPTAAAAWLLARRHEGQCISAQAPLLNALGRVPLQHCGLPGETIACLSGMGFRRLREVFGLPRAELTRRIGREAMEWLDRLRGLAPEALSAWHPPDRFEHTLEFDSEVRGGDALLFPLRRLTAALANNLAARDGGVQRFTLLLAHAGIDGTRIEVHLAAPQREAATLFALARTRLERVALPAPVRALTLRATQLPSFHPGLRDLFEPVRGEGLDWPALCERLNARLGEQALRRFAPVSEHRPGRAWRKADAAAHETDIERRPRPLWLLQQPCVLRGPLRVLSGPERIESGWWDGDDQRRDYYRIETSTGQQAWAFRAAGAPQGWMLHGWFA